MATTRKRPHILVPAAQFRNVENYKPHRKAIRLKSPGPPAIGRFAHAAALKTSLEAAADHAARRRAAIGLDVSGAKPGVYLEFESLPGWELTVASLENTRSKDPHKHIEVVAVSKRSVVDEKGEPAPVQHIAVLVPDGQVGHFLGQLERYALTTPKENIRERRHEDVYDRVAAIRLATLRALWTDDDAAYPLSDDDPIWWEVWLRRTDDAELSRLYELAALASIRLGTRRLEFEDRIVILAYASARQLSASLDVMGDLAELQRAKETATFFVEQNPTGQAEWVNDLLGRTAHAADGAPAVCILDTGVNRGHPLLEGALTGADCHAVDVTWETHDHAGHGTEMAGIALYGDLVPVLEGSGPVPLRHRLESVKILPPVGFNHPDLYGAITADAASRAEIQAPARRRVFSMAVTALDTRDRGQPTSWSSALDALAAGRSFDPSSKGLIYFDETPHQRLFVVSAGNVEPASLERAYLDRSDTEPVHDPAQAWNALTVGAYTEKAIIGDPSWNDWSPVAPPGDLSPWSTTSVIFTKQWPIKPDVVMEGGNIVHDAADQIDYPCDDLCLLTTHYKPADKLLVSTWGTSPATAQVARLAASVSAFYPDLWPETIRGLVVHSAEWTPAMKRRLEGANGKRARAKLVCRYGFGVPSVERALRSAGNAVTLLVQDSIQPFDHGAMGDFHLHELPWPGDVLASIGEATVRVRVTLSYFIEPNPGRRGWQRKHRYQSHGLRFDMKGPSESLDVFRKRLNQMALDEEEDRPATGGDSTGWFLGERARNRGSLHSDFITGSAAEIAARGVLAVYPVTGWWKELKKRDRSKHGARYALIVSIETDAIDADIWTAVAAQVGIPVETEISFEAKLP